LGEVLVAFTAGSTIELGFAGDERAFFGGQRPTARLGVGRLVRIFECQDGGTQEGEEW
jgi:hypothetical protein